MSENDIVFILNLDISKNLHQLQQAFDDRSVFQWSDKPNSNPSLAKAKYAVCWKPPKGILKSLPNLEIIFSWGAGVDHILDDPDLPDLPIVRFVDPDLTGRMVEYVVLQVLMHSRQQRRYDAFQRSKKWVELSDPKASELRVGIMGFGELGKAAARGLLPLGYQLNSWSRTPKQMRDVTSYYGEDGLQPFLANTDILVSLLPHTKETHGLINKKLIEQLARNGPFKAPVIINAGRGGSQVEADIIEALKNKSLHGVSLDVFENEPLKQDSPLWEFKNAILTPHIAAISNISAIADHVKKQIARHESGRELEHVIDVNLGY